MDELKNFMENELKKWENVEFEDQYRDDIEEPTHIEKISGMITAPGETFDLISKFKPKVIDWLLPILVLIIVSILSNFVMMKVPYLKNDILERQMEIIKENYEHQVETGEMTAEEAETQYNKIVERIQESGGGTGIIGTGIGIIFGVFLFFFIVALGFFILAKFILKGRGSYGQALVAYGLPFYITAIQAILITLISVLAGDAISSTSLNTIVGADNLSLSGFLMAKIDPMRIWFYALVGIAFAKMFKSDNTTKYIISVFALWIGFGLLLLLLAQYMPWIGRFIM